MQCWTCRYLLKNGAVCEANTFDGERCLYGALTIDIRNVLIERKVLGPTLYAPLNDAKLQVITSRMITRGYYDEFLRKLHENGDYFDVIFCVHRELIKGESDH